MRVGYNRVFGYYIEVPNAHRDRVPDDYSRKQTLAGAERYVTPDLKEDATIVLHARERAIAREQELLAGAAAMVAIEARSLADAAAAAATLDVAQSLATVAEEGHWVRPAMNSSSTLRITGGRHPLVERLPSLRCGIGPKVNANPCRARPCPTSRSSSVTTSTWCIASIHSARGSRNTE